MSARERIRAARSAARRMVQATSRGLLGLSAPRRSCLLVVRDVRTSAEKVDRIRPRLEFAFGRPLLDEELLVVERPSLALVSTSRAVVEVDQGTVPRWMHQAFPHVFAMDFQRNALDGWEMVRVAYELEAHAIHARRSAVQQRFRAFADGVLAKRLGRAYVFGTGPSLERARDRDFGDGYVVVCNTIVRDADMWAHLRPDFIAAGDAIYHFGHTAHARAFRRDLGARLRESAGATMFVYPELFDPIVRRELGDLESQLAPLPFDSHADVTRSLLRRPVLPSSSNVRNILLLPLGCTLSRRVHLWGFDGRAPTDTLFWSNSTRHAYPELMPALIEEHPAFYETLVPKGRETQYVKSVHGDELERRLVAAEGRGFEFVMMHRSWTETLNRRFRGEGAVADAG